MPKLIKGWFDSQTVTVGELIECLQSFPSDMPVAYTWESQVTPVEIERIQVMPDTDKVHGPVLLLDAET